MGEFLYKTFVPKHYRPDWNPSKTVKVIGTVLYWVNMITAYQRGQKITELRTECNRLRAELGMEPLPAGPVVTWLKEQTEKRVQSSE